MADFSLFFYAPCYQLGVIILPYLRVEVKRAVTYEMLSVVPRTLALNLCIFQILGKEGWGAPVFLRSKEPLSSAHDDSSEVSAKPF